MRESQAIRAGRVTAISHPDDASLARLREQLSSRGYGATVTPHFVVCRRSSGAGRVMVMHTFDEVTIDEDLPPMVADELGPLGIIQSSKEYDDTLRAIVASTCSTSLECPECGRVHLDLPAVWRRYCLNTLHRLRGLMAEPPDGERSADSHVVQFAAIYRRIIECCEGVSVLDVGSSLGFLPVLLAEHFDGMSVVGCDNRQEAVACAADLASAAGVDQVAFIIKDVRSSEFTEVGMFDTVTAIHVLEHLDERDIPTALSNLLHVTARRLIIAVPYEEHAQPLYGHEQTFTPATLDRWGRWCVECLGSGSYRCEDVSGGLLVVDRPQPDRDAG
jgi:SAM-dependent methyltransferase